MMQRGGLYRERVNFTLKYLVVLLGASDKWQIREQKTLRDGEVGSNQKQQA